MILGACGAGRKPRRDLDPAEAIAAVEHGLLSAAVPQGAALPRMSIEERMRYHAVPAVSVAVVADGKLSWA